MMEVGDLPLDAPATPDFHAMTTGTDLDSVTLDPDPVTTATSSCHDPHRSCSRSFHRSSHAETSHITEAPVPTAAIMIHLTTDPHLTGTLPEMTADPDIGPGKHHYKPDQGSSSTSQTPSWKHKDKRHKQVNNR